MEIGIFSDKVSVKAVVIGFIGYLIIATVAMMIVVRLWMPADVTDKAVLLSMAETDRTLLLVQEILGTTLGILAGFVACRLSGGKGLKSALVLGVLFVLYSVLGIYLHPSHPILLQIAKPLMPIPLTLFGGWLCLHFSSGCKTGV